MDPYSVCEMIDRYLSGIQNSLLRPVALRLSSYGITADALTLVGFLFGVISAALIVTGYDRTALILFFLNRLFDGLMERSRA